MLAHCLLHLGLGHFQEKTHPREWNAACDAFIGVFLSDLKLGRPPDGFGAGIELPARTEEPLYEAFCERGIPQYLQGLGTGGPAASDMIAAAPATSHWAR